DDVLLSDIVVAHLEHADDMALFSTSQEGLQDKLDSLAAWAALNQMQINTDKTVVMIFKNPQKKLPALSQPFTMYGRNLSIVTHTSYVGIWLSSAKGNVWDMHFHKYHLKAQTAANMIFFVESRTGTIPPHEGCILYKAQIDPILTWGCPVTGVGTKKQLDELEDVQHMYLRRLLGVQTRSQCCILFSELGIWPLRFRRLDLQLRYLLYAVALPASHLVSAALMDSQELARTARSGWFSDLQNQLSSLSIALPLQPDEDQVRITLELLKTAVYAHVQDEIISSPKLDLLQSRLRSGIQQHGSPLQFRSYLRLTNYSARRTITQLLVSDHRLSIERLRWANTAYPYKIPRELRLCRLCTEKVEDPLHALFICTGQRTLIYARR
ncbi:hypothetical protein EXIGLDRAFT_559602, partial [Exidia glandulosa HHB12029]